MPETPENPFETAVQSDVGTECEVMADGRVAHYMQARLDGTWGCVRCPATAGKHGLAQPIPA